MRDPEATTGGTLVTTAATAAFGEPVTLDDARWHELVVATTAGVAAWNDLLVHWHMAGQTRIGMHHSTEDDGCDYLATARFEYRQPFAEHITPPPGYRTGWVSSANGWAVIRERSTGRIARMKGYENGKKRGGLGLDMRHSMVPIPNPKSWRGLDRKPIDQVLAKLQLLAFNVHVMKRLDFDAVRVFHRSNDQ